MTNNDERPISGIARRTVLKGAAWSAPVIAVAVSTPLAAASENPPEANYASVTSVVNPKVGSNPTFRARGQYYDGADYIDGELTAGTLLTLTFANGAAADSVTNLVGLTYVSGDPTTGGPVIYAVSANTSTDVSVKLNNVRPVGGIITAEIQGGDASSTITA